MVFISRLFHEQDKVKPTNKRGKAREAKSINYLYVDEMFQLITQDICERSQMQAALIRVALHNTDVNMSEVLQIVQKGLGLHSDPEMCEM